MSSVESEVSWQDWIGRTQTRADLISAAPVAALSATLDCESTVVAQGRPLPPAWHWLYFQDAVASAALDRDGHAKRGSFLPSISLPQRMWVGGRVRIISPLVVGEEARRESSIAAIRQKQGSSGELVFVTIKHELYQAGALAIEEEQDLVYRERGTGRTLPNAQPAPANTEWQRVISPDSVLLFRYSALTFNSHRIHYDRDYAISEEGYSALVVQGPLTATLLLDLLHRNLPKAQVASFEFRAVRPLLENSRITLQGRRDGISVKLWALDDSGALATDMHVELRSA
jgi:3-methylfumaryl-CoA hydratase